jgi:hypothetical protein
LSVPFQVEEGPVAAENPAASHVDFPRAYSPSALPPQSFPDHY